MFDKFKVVPVVVPIDSTGAALTQDVVNMANYARCTFIFQIGNLAANSAANLILMECEDASKTGADAIASRYRISEAFPSDTFGAWTTLATTGLALAAATDDGKTVMIEIDAIDLSANHNWVYITHTGGAGATLVSCVAILSGQRYAPDMTAIA